MDDSDDEGLTEEDREDDDDDDDEGLTVDERDEDDGLTVDEVEDGVGLGDDEGLMLGDDEDLMLEDDKTVEDGFRVAVLVITELRVDEILEEVVRIVEGASVEDEVGGQTSVKVLPVHFPERISLIQVM